MKAWTEIPAYNGAFERETLINFSDGEPVASYYTRNPFKMRELRQLAKDKPEEVKVIQDNEFCVEVELPKKWIKIRPPRELTEEQHAEMVERGRALYEIQQKKKAEQALAAKEGDEQ